MLIKVGVPNSYLVILEFSGINTLTVVPLASTCLIFGQPVRSISAVKPVQFYIDRISNFGIFENIIWFLSVPAIELAVLCTAVHPSIIIPLQFNRYLNK